MDRSAHSRSDQGARKEIMISHNPLFSLSTEPDAETYPVLFCRPEPERNVSTLQTDKLLCRIEKQDDLA